MRQLLPEPLDPVEPLDVYPHQPRPRPQSRPWVLINMIESTDGATSVEGLSGGLGGPADKKVFSAVRASADWIVVGAGTARAERYGPPRCSEQVLAARRSAGRADRPGLAIITSSLELEPDLPALQADIDGWRPTIITGLDHDPGRADALSPNADVVVVPTARPSPATVLEVLAERSADTVLVEGGPLVNGQFVTAGLVDELCLTVSPMIAGGPSSRMVVGADAEPLHLELAGLMESEGMLFARYLRR